MKKLILFLFLTVNILAFSRTTVNWNVEKSYNNKITVTCELRGDIFHTFNVDVQPFSTSLLAEGKDMDLYTGIILKVEKELPYSDDVAYYKCYLEKDFEVLTTFYFKVRNELIIEKM